MWDPWKEGRERGCAYTELANISPEILSLCFMARAVCTTQASEKNGKAIFFVQNITNLETNWGSVGRGKGRLDLEWGASNSASKMGG